MRFRRGSAFALAALAALAALVSGGGVRAEDAKEPRVHRLVRVFHWENGFPWSYAGGVEQDRRGFLWVSTTTGLYRFDGTRARRMSDSLGTVPGGTAAGRVILYGNPGGVFEAHPEGLVRLDRGPEEPEADALTMAVATDGAIWRVRDGVLQRLESDGVWTTLTVPGEPGDPPRAVRPGRAGRVYVLSRRNVWGVEADRTFRRIASVERAILVVEREDGRVVVGANQDPAPVTTRVFEVADGEARPVFEERGSRLISMTERGDTLWVSMDRALQALGPDDRPLERVFPPAVPALGYAIVDREGSLWMATSRGLVQLPEPDVYAVAPARGEVTRDMARTAGGVWGTFWGTLAFLPEERGPVPLIDAGEHYTRLCRDGGDRVWTSGRGGMLALGPDGSVAALEGEWAPTACATGTGSRRWIVSRGRDLFTVDPAEGAPRRVSLRFDDDEDLTTVAEAGDGTLWLGRGRNVCALPAAEVLAGNAAAPRCEAIPDARDAVDLEEMPSGDLWALTAYSGSVHRRAGGKWEVLPGSRKLGVSWILAMAPSPSGGVWLVGQGIVVRVGERTDLPDGWEVLERPTAWNGLIAPNVAAIEEDADSTLWLGTDVGIQRIPPEIRFRRADPPGVEWVEGSVNGVPLDPSGPIRLPWLRHRLSAHFAALTYRDPAAVRYRMRLRRGDAWSAPAEDGRFTFVDLPSGRYDLEVVASLDGARWSAEGARLAFEVRLPWYARPWFLGAAFVGIAGLGHLGYRLRVRRRLAGERQRTRIAMDLHDEVGSGLGTIAVLAGIAGRPDLSPERRADAAGRIAAVSQELARALGDIVWSLRASSGFLDALWNQLLDRARPLFASGSPAVSFEAPDPVPREALSLVVRRNLHLVVYEALHNAARHSGASRVVLRLEREGPGWRLEVEDDGRGLPAESATPSVRRGLGIEAMRARVAEMGGAIEWDRGPSGGTRVTVRFRPSRPSAYSGSSSS